jgi:hypothetical protein
MLHDTKDSKDLESTYPLIEGEDESPLRYEKDRNIDHSWANITNDPNLWRSLFFGLLSLNALFGVILALCLNKMNQPLLTSQRLIPKSSFTSAHFYY